MVKTYQGIVESPRRHGWTRGKVSNRAAIMEELLRFYNRLEHCSSEGVSRWLVSAVRRPAVGGVRQVSLDFPFRTSQLAVSFPPNQCGTVPDGVAREGTFCRKRISP